MNLWFIKQYLTNNAFQHITNIMLYKSLTLKTYVIYLQMITLPKKHYS